MKIAYVGVKLDGETAFSDKTGITWMPDDAFEVANDVATKMLQHPDVFAKDEGKAAAKTDDTKDTSGITLSAGTKVDPTDKTVSVLHYQDGTTKVLDGLEKEELHALAKQLEVKVHPNAGAANVAAKLLEAFPAP